jgi:hypothetical protein
MARELLLRRRIERASEVGAPEIVVAVAHAAADLKRLKTEIAKPRDHGSNIEGGVNGIAGAGVGEREVEQCPGRHACAATA